MLILIIVGCAYNEPVRVRPHGMSWAAGLVCGPDDEAFGMSEAAGGWALSACTDDFATIVFGALFTLTALRRLCRMPAGAGARAHPQCAETRVPSSIYAVGGGDDSRAEEESAGLLDAGMGEAAQSTVQRLAADRSPEAVAQLRAMADEDIFAHCETRQLRLLGDALASIAVGIRVWGVAAPAHSTAAAVVELVAWLVALRLTRVETATRRPRSSLIMTFWALATAAPASTALRGLLEGLHEVDEPSVSVVAADSTGSSDGVSAVHRAAIAVALGLALICVTGRTVHQHHRSTVWQSFQGAWSL